jgi:hypothetical protein
MKPTIAILAAVFVLSGGWLYESHQSATRQNLAVSWDSSSANFAAVGIRGENLVAFLPDADDIGCDVFLRSVTTDRKTVLELRAKGFQQISCGTRKARLPNSDAKYPRSRNFFSSLF